MSDHLNSLAESELAVSPPPELDPVTTSPPPVGPPAAPTTASFFPTSTATRPKSPPLAFEKTPNDALVPFITSPQIPGLHPRSASLSPSLSAMGGIGSPSNNEAQLQAVIHRQSIAIDKIHDAFAAERKAWRSERDSLYQRIAALEQLLKTHDHHSPAKSPTASPSIISPSSKPQYNSARLPSIAEHDNTASLSLRRHGAPRSIELPGGRTRLVDPAVSFTTDNGQLQVEEVPISPPTTARARSPIPPHNLDHAGHTPLRTTRVPTPPPQNMMLDGVDDTPTRNNTHINTFLTQSHEEDEDPALKGPLNMPELPNRPDETNFTLDALSKRLEEVARSPDDRQPTVFKVPTPGVASPVDDTASALNPKSGRATDRSHSNPGSNVKSPSAWSPDGAPLSQQQSQELKMHNEFEQGGIKLKKKPSINFGQPLGQLSGFGPRKLS